VARDGSVVVALNFTPVPAMATASPGRRLHEGSTDSAFYAVQCRNSGPLRPSRCCRGWARPVREITCPRLRAHPWCTRDECAVNAADAYGKLKVLSRTSEVAPLIKTGGLADVSAARGGFEDSARTCGCVPDIRR